MTRAANQTVLYLAVAGAAALSVAGGAAFWYATTQNAVKNRGLSADMTVTVGAQSCEPNAITVEGGKRSFEIVNTSDRPIEWEILDGVMVVAERENIAPGFRQVLAAQLTPGNYEITCGLLSNPRGRLTVTPSTEAASHASEVTLRKFLGPLSEYRVFLVLQGNAAVKGAGQLRDAIAAGDLDAARAAWLATRAPYRRIEPLAARFSDLKNQIDPNAAYLQGREEDPGFTGFHRIEYGLFGESSTGGLEPFADALFSSMTALAQRLKDTNLEPQLLIDLPGSMAGQIAEAQLPNGENVYSGTDLLDLQSSVEGIDKLVGLLRSVLVGADPALDAEIGARLDAVKAQLDALKGAEGFPNYADVPAGTRKALADDLVQLQGSLAKLPEVIGMN